MLLYADLLFTGGTVYTADARRPWARAVAVHDGKILALGDDRELDELRGPRTEVVDLRGRLLLPGFTESHVHFIELALRASQVEATACRSAGEVAGVVGVHARGTRPGGWVRGGGWDANTWTDGVRPHRRMLDEASPHNPVALDSKELHAVWANSAALREAGIGHSTPDIAGGVIERDPDGEPTGILRENAVVLLSRAYPEPGGADLSAAVKAAFPAMWSTGIIALHNANDERDARAFRTYQELRDEGELRLRVVQQIPLGNLRHARALGLRSGLGDEWLRVGGVKMFVDGALGSRTANMLQPYEGQPGEWGVSTLDPEEMLELALSASESGLSLTIHAIGDRANREVLDVLAEVRRQERGRGAPRLRHRIEHVQLIDRDDLPRLAALDVIASVQPVHATSDMLIAERYWGGERSRNAYAFRSLLDSGAHLAFGSDSPIEPHAPLVGIHAAVTRRRADGTPGPEGWQSQERISVAEAVDAYTYWPAYTVGEEGYRGSITPGKVADLAVLSRDMFAIPPMEILSAEVDLTVLAGQVIHRRG